MKINFFGPVGPTGYGRFTTFLAPAIKKLGHNINVVPNYLDEMRVADPKIVEMVKTCDEKMLDYDVSVRLSVATPNEIMSFHGKKRVGFTMLEVDKIPPYWVYSLNSCDEVWTPSEWGKKVFENSGVTKPIRVVPGGVDLNMFNKWREPLVPRNGKFRFLSVGKYEKRKGQDLILKAYSEEFKDSDNVELIMLADSIKLFDPNFNVYKEIVNLRLPSDRPDLQIVDGMVPNYGDMGRLYTSADCFVCPTRGEGWNLPLIEAMACGLPSIVTNWSAHTDFANESNAYMLNDFKMVKADQRFAMEFIKYGQWAEPSLNELKAKMRYVYEHRDEAKKKGEQAAIDMKNWTWDKAAEKAVKALEELTK